LKSLLFQVDERHRDGLIAELWEAGTVGIIEETGGVRAFFEEGAHTEALAKRYPVIDERRESPEPMTDFSRENWDPILVGERFFVAPPWLQVETPPGRIRLTVGASTAFGTGRHESTQLMLEAMEREIRSGIAVADVGCGAGILSIAALKLGATRVLSCDIHFDAVQTCREAGLMAAFVGSADGIRSELADLVLANISTQVLDRIAGELKRITHPGGRLLISGFVRDNPPRAYLPLTIAERQEWQCWTCDRDGIRPQTPSEQQVQIHPQQWW
jgi:ribosomal protein L11 methyltransferase